MLRRVGIRHGCALTLMQGHRTSNIYGSTRQTKIRNNIKVHRHTCATPNEPHELAKNAQWGYDVVLKHNVRPKPLNLPELTI